MDLRRNAKGEGEDQRLNRCSKSAGNTVGAAMTAYIRMDVKLTEWRIAHVA